MKTDALEKAIDELGNKRNQLDRLNDEYFEELKKGRSTYAFIKDSIEKLMPEIRRLAVDDARRKVEEAENELARIIKEMARAI
jgi:thymidylate kinase